MEMVVGIDFRLNQQFGVVERIIFRFVLNGIRDPKKIYDSIPIFSDSVMANALKNLINRQILTINRVDGMLSISEPLLAILNACINKTFKYDFSVELCEKLTKNGLYIGSGKESFELKHAVLEELLPNIKLDLYSDSIDFIIKRRG